ncbi:YcaO-like family protein [Piscinibacter sakaiensis]|uniref:YcaO domain-containing protein n=1 Tax=Piscinibacter sakaiensis TaxID=1547922 RepID=A0A0K8P0S3_PISS1|nr:YcaO-like family protein [Piscinibacter sakaiensis]GAP36226.1 hypothetical protein ISF6_2066 [Piscinibacter sakaiensis]
MSLAGWRSRAGLCLMRPREHAGAAAAPCLRCLHDRLHEAGFAPRGPVEVADDAGWQAAFAAAARDDPQVAGHPLATPVLRLDGAHLRRHRLVARPGCPVCGPQQRAALGRWRGPALPVEALGDPLLGLFSCAECIVPLDGDPQALCHAASVQVHTAGNRHAVSARGQGHDAARAALGQLGEALERYAAFRPEPWALRDGRARSLPWPALQGDALFGLDPAQQALVGHARLDGRRRLAWLPAQRLADGAARAVPAAAVFLDRADWRPEPRVGPSVSHGLAAHRSAAAAQAHAADELVERTAMTRAWHTRDFGTRLPDEALDAPAAALARRCRDAGLSLRLMALPWPAQRPVVLALLWTPRAAPWFLLGSGSARRWADAADAALLEAAAGWQALCRRPEPLPARPRLRAAEGTAGHHRWHAGEPRAARVVQAFVDGSRPSGRLPPDGPDVGACEALLALAPDSVAADLTPPDLAACGWSVQRVLAPGLPIYGHGRVGTPGRFLAAWGWPPAALPHPYR